MACRVTEIAPDTYRLSTFAPDYGIQFNQFLVIDDEPFLMHTGFRSQFARHQGRHGFRDGSGEAAVDRIQPLRIRRMRIVERVARDRAEGAGRDERRGRDREPRRLRDPARARARRRRSPGDRAPPAAVPGHAARASRLGRGALLRRGREDPLLLGSLLPARRSRAAERISTRHRGRDAGRDRRRHEGPARERPALHGAHGRDAEAAREPRSAHARDDARVVVQRRRQGRDARLRGDAEGAARS